MKKLFVLLLAGGATLLAADKPADKIAGGPFVVNATSRTATVVWIVQTDELTLQTPGGAKPRTSPSLHVEKTILTGLKPNTRYEYGVAGQDAGKGSFKTAPSNSDPAPYQFVVYGDTRTRHDVHRNVMEAIAKLETPDFVLHTGDLVADGTIVHCGRCFSISSGMCFGTRRSFLVWGIMNETRITFARFSRKTDRIIRSTGATGTLS